MIERQARKAPKKKREKNASLLQRCMRSWEGLMRSNKWFEHK